MKIRSRRHACNAAANQLDLFVWAEARRSVNPPPYHVRWVRQRWPDISQSCARLIAEAAGLGGIDGR